ncbi:SRPBCC domain-containing protein [Hyphobacterium sp.]|uniref:SRPBCC domain-containing protein n=1 Tax=Hyphobacterium sp. TaxID=2004662 RepID=UPI003B515FBF
MNTVINETIAPVEKSVTVDKDAATAFRFFTEKFDAWWPKETHSLGADREGVTPARVVMESGIGGRLFEVAQDGTEHYWGTIGTWQPGERLIFSWGFDKPEAQRTEVEVVFTDLGGGRTRIDLTHRNWEKDPKGAELRKGYNNGWEPVMASLLERCNAIG